LTRASVDFYEVFRGGEIIPSNFHYSSTVRVNLTALAHNVRVIQNSANRAEICAVVKANSYGQHAIKVAWQLQQLNVNWFAVANLTEGLELRANGIVGHVILLFGNHYLDDIFSLRENKITPVVFSLENLISLAKIIDSPFKIHLELDTGMCRTGILPKDIQEVISVLKTNENIKLEGFFTHFACADQLDSKYTDKQLSLFRAAIAQLLAEGIKPVYLHAENSAGILDDESREFSLVRSGISLYGISPYSSDINTQLKSVLTWKTKPLQIKNIAVGQTVSYSCTWHARQATTIAIIPVGYADGYPRLASNIGHALVNGIKAKIVGNLCMDFMMLDVGNCGRVTTNSDVVLIGNQNNSSISIHDIANWSSTIPYEIMCHMGARANYIFND